MAITLASRPEGGTRRAGGGRVQGGRGGAFRPEFSGVGRRGARRAARGRKFHLVCGEIESRFHQSAHNSTLSQSFQRFRVARGVSGRDAMGPVRYRRRFEMRAMGAPSGRAGGRGARGGSVVPGEKGLHVGIKADQHLSGRGIFARPGTTCIAATYISAPTCSEAAQKWLFGAGTRVLRERRAKWAKVRLLQPTRPHRVGTGVLMWQLATT